MTQKKRHNEFSGVALITGGFILVAMSIGGFWVGSLFDEKFKSAPIGALVGLVLGTAIGFFDLYLIAKRIINQQPIPTREQQEEAESNWEKSADPEGNHDETNE